MNGRLNLAAIVFAMALLVFATAALNSGMALAQKDSGGLDVRVSIADDSFQSLKERPVMVSVTQEGAVVKQREVHVNSSASFSLPAGLYDVRLEGDGMQTLTKRGIHVNDGERTNIVGGPMRVGSGVKTIEYAIGGLSREEIAARLAKLEAAVADIQKTRQTR